MPTESSIINTAILESLSLSLSSIKNHIDAGFKEIAPK